MKNEQRGVCRAVLAVVLGGIFSTAALADSITLEQAGERMMAYAKQFRMLELDRQAAEERANRAYNERFPRVQLSLGYVQTEQNIISQDNDTFTEGTSQYPTTTNTFSIVQPLYNAEKFRQYPLAVAEQQVVALRQELEINQLWADLLRRFLTVAEAQNQREQQALLIDARKSLLVDAETLQFAGRIEETQVLGLKSELLSAESQALIAENQASEALDRLMELVGPGVNSVRVSVASDRLVSPARLTSVLPRDQLLTVNPSVQLAEAEVVVAQRQAKLVNAAYYPKITARIQTEQEITEGSLFGGGSEVESTDFGVDITWLLYEGGTVDARSREADQKMLLAEARRDDVAAAVERRYESLINALRRQAQILDALQAELLLAENRVGASLLQVESGRAGLGVTQELELKRDALRVRIEQQALAYVKTQVELYALFGALDINRLSQVLRGQRVVPEALTPQ